MTDEIARFLAAVRQACLSKNSRPRLSSTSPGARWPSWRPAWPGQAPQRQAWFLLSVPLNGSRRRLGGVMPEAAPRRSSPPW